MIDAFHLPALPALPAAARASGTGGGAVELLYPQLRPADLAIQIDALLEARQRHLAERPVNEIVEIVDRVAARFLDPGDEVRRLAIGSLPAITGISAPMAALVLDRMAADWRAPALRELLIGELGEPEVLDGFRTRAGLVGRSRAYGPALTTHIFSGNVPGVAVTSLVRVLLVKSASLGKTAAGEPLLAPLFARALAEEDEGIARCIAVTYWEGGDAEMERVALQRADAVIAYGGDAAVSAIRASSPPGARFLGYGHHISFGVVAREALTSATQAELARRAAVDVATFDQQGCVSPHLFYVEEGGEVSPGRWAELLADEMAALEPELPRGRISPGEASAIQQLRGELEFASYSRSEARLHTSSGGTEWTVSYEPESEFSASCLNRMVRVKPIADLRAVPALVLRHADLLQTVGVAGPRDRFDPMVAALGAMGVTRVATIGSMAWPAPGWRHDGRRPLGDLIRWCDWEE